MIKIPTIFVRDLSQQPALVIPEWVHGCEWVRDGEGKATRKWDGSAVLVRDGKRYKRRELRGNELAPVGFESLGTDEVTGKTVGWVPVGEGPEDRWFREASCPDWDRVFTAELVGPKINGNKDGFPTHVLAVHGTVEYPEAPRTFEALRDWLAGHPIEGLVWWHPDGRRAKIKRRDFGLKW